MEITLNTNGLKRKVENGEKFLLLDVRDKEKYESGTLCIDGIETRNIAYIDMRDREEEIQEELAALPQDKTIITICTTGNKATKAALHLRERGYKTLSLEGGLTAWNAN